MANLFWVWWTATYDGTTNRFATSSGGVASVAAPTSSDTVTFDTLSNATAYTVTISATLTCSDLTIWNPLVWAITFAGTSPMNLHWNFSAPSGGTWTYAGNMTFVATSGTKTITTNGITMPWFMHFNGSGGTFQLADNLTSSNGSGIQRTAGTFDANGKDVILTAWSGTATWTFTGSNAFYNLKKIPSSPTKTASMPLTGDITITNVFTIDMWATVTNRVLVSSSVLGTARTITSASNSFNNADFRDITGAWAASWDLSAITGWSGNCGGNSGITFTTADDNYWIGGTWSWSTAWEWSQSSGWAANGRVPLPQDTAIFDANSFSAGSQTVTQDMPRIPTTNWTGVTNTPTWTTSTAASVFGSITLVSGMTLTASTQAYTFEWRTTHTLTNAGKTWAKNFTLAAPGWTLTLQDAFTTWATNSLSVTFGTFSANNFDLSIGTFSSSVSSTRAIIMWSGTWTLLWTWGTLWSVNATLSITPWTSTIKITDTSNGVTSFTGGWLTYNNIWYSRWASTWSNTIVNSNTFNDFKDDGSVAHSLLFTAGTTQHVTTFTVNGSVWQEITINSTTTATHALVKDWWWTITCDYLNIQHSVATPTLTWLATNSTDNQAVSTAGSGWYFGAFPVWNNSWFFAIL